MPCHVITDLSPAQQPDLSYSLTEYSTSRLDVFEHVATWDFPIFELEEKAGDHILSNVRAATVALLKLAHTHVFVLTDSDHFFKLAGWCVQYKAPQN